MATKIIENHVCDISGDEATYPKVAFSLDNVDYEIDLNRDYRERLVSALAEYIASARRTGGRRKTPVIANGAAVTVSTTLSVEENKAKREWLRANGWPGLADRGRIPADADEAYTRAMAQKAAKPEKSATRRKRTAKTAA